MDEIETSFPKTQQLQPFICIRHTDDIFFIWTHREEQFKLFLIKLFLRDLNEFHSKLEIYVRNTSVWC